jgi:hypothetical protein
MGMARLGREFEVLVRNLEELFTGSSVEVRSPDRITGRITGRLREVDITLRANVGSSPVLIGIECRDRAARADVQWIEQIVTKRDEIGAHKMIAVSSKGFSAAAIKLARERGIEARTLREVLPVEAFDWLEAREFRPCFVSYRLIDISIEVSSPQAPFQVDFPGGKLTGDHPIFFRKSDGTMATINNLLDHRWITLHALGIPMDEPHRIRTILKTMRPEDAMAIRCTTGSADVTQVSLDIEVFRTQGDPIPISRTYEYASEEGHTLAQGFDVRIPDGTGSTKLAFHRSGDGERFSMRLTKNKVSQAKRLRSPVFWYYVSPADDLSVADSGSTGDDN